MIIIMTTIIIIALLKYKKYEDENYMKTNLMDEYFKRWDINAACKSRVLI